MSNIKVVKKGDKVEIKQRKRYPYVEILSLLLQGEDVFIKVNRKMAYHIKRRLNEGLKMAGIEAEIDSIPSVYDGEEGYMFRMVMWRGGDKVWIEKEKLVREIEKRIAKAENELKFLRSQPEDKSLTAIQAMLKTRIETLKEVIDIINEI